MLCVKIGGSLITDKTIPYKSRLSTLYPLARILKNMQTPLIICHGVGSFAHPTAAKYLRKDGYTSTWGAAKVAYDVLTINTLVMQIFIAEDLPVVSFSPRSFLFAHEEKTTKVFLSPIQEALTQGFIPVIHGDGIFDSGQKLSVFSGEKILNHLAYLFKKRERQIEKIIHLCDVDGVLDSNNNVITEITKNNWKEMQKYLYSSNKIDVTGGMRHKVGEALKLTKFGIKSWIINGNDITAVTQAFEENICCGTVIQ